jgi:uncharacterized membrane protein (DUF485 family)
VPPEQEHRDAAAYEFVAALGGAKTAADYPVTMVGEMTAAALRAYALENQILALPNYVQVGSPTGDRLYIANPDFDLRYDQSFPLAKLAARAPSGTIDPDEGTTELERIRNQQRRFPVWVTILGYAVQSTGLTLIPQPTPWSPVGAATLGLMVGVLVYGLGAVLYFGPATSFLPWMLLMLLTAYAGQWVGTAVLGSYASGFGGGLTLIMFALAISRRCDHRHADLDDVDRRRRAHRAAAMAAAIQLTSLPNRRAMHD